MSELDIIKDLARQCLIIPAVTSNPDSSLWDRAQRLARIVECICRLPELAESGFQIDHFCLITATYLSDTGLARCYLEQKGKAADWTPHNGSGNGLLDISAKIAAEKLTGIIEKPRIEKINSIIIESGVHTTQRTEAMILSDARNLDDMGAAGIFNEFRRFAFNGKGVSGALQSWKSKVGYGYWQVRIKEGFRFEQTRKLAERRLAATEHFMNRLKAEVHAQDIEELSPKSTFV